MAEHTEHSVTHAQAHLEWKIKKFVDLPKDANYCVTSPTFPLSQSKWCLQVFPNGQLCHHTVGYIGLYLKKDETDEECCVGFKMGINREDGVAFATREFDNCTFKLGNEVGCPFIVKRIILTSTEGIFDSDGSLRFFCSARTENNKEEGSQTISPYVIPTIAEDLNRLYLNKHNTDITIKVKNKHLVAHKCILEARSNVFAAMFSHNMAENRSGEVEIADCEPNTFEEFVLHLYTGRLDMFSPKNASSLYKVADKYNVKELKEECVRCMMRELSVDSFCDVVHLAVMHGESDLLTAASTFFCNNLEEILPTPKWKVLSSENPMIPQKLRSMLLEKQRRHLALFQAKVKSNSNSVQSI